MVNNDDALLISGIQNFAYCRRRWALVHIEQMWEENSLTLEGQYMHEKVHDSTFTERRGNTILSRGMAVFSHSLGIVGVCDMVELEKCDNGISIVGRLGKYKVYPVEYKHGKPNDSHSDELQLCAQAMCLEEMLCTEISEGAIYYGETKRRVAVEFNGQLRTELCSMIAEMHDLTARHYTPNVKRKKTCSNCSMKDKCFPEILESRVASEYVKKVLEEDHA